MEYATRMILIPEELYQALVFQRENTQAGPLGSHLTSTLSQMDKILHTSALNDEQKNALYNSQYKRLKNLKDETLERQPISKVKLQSVSDDITSTILDVLSKMQKTSRLSSVSSSPSTLESYQSEKDSELHESLLDDENGGVTPKVSPKKRSQSTPPVKKEDFPQKTPHLKRIASIAEKNKVFDDKADKILKEMSKNKQLYGIDDKNQILDNRGGIIKNSDAKQAVLRLLNKPDSYSPPGMRSFRARISRTPLAQLLFNEAKEEINLESKQQGKGKTIKPLKNKAKKMISIKFKPTLW